VRAHWADGESSLVGASQVPHELLNGPASSPAAVLGGAQAVLEYARHMTDVLRFNVTQVRWWGMLTA
jgi:hypothetical protein